MLFYRGLAVSLFSGLKELAGTQRTLQEDKGIVPKYNQLLYHAVSLFPLSVFLQNKQTRYKVLIIVPYRCMFVEMEREQSHVGCFTLFSFIMLRFIKPPATKHTDDCMVSI